MKGVMLSGDPQDESINIDWQKKLLPKTPSGNELRWLHYHQRITISVQHSYYSHRASFLYIPVKHPHKQIQVMIKGVLYVKCNLHQQTYGFDKRYKSVTLLQVLTGEVLWRCFSLLTIFSSEKTELCSSLWY